MPLTDRAAKAIGDQQTYVAARWPRGSPWLFPDTHHDDGADRPISYRFLHRRLRNWETHIDLRDEAGLPVTVSSHQFRHTLGTRLINSGVPQHIVQRILTHASPGMTDVYARLHDSTIRIAFDRFQQQRVDIAGRCSPMTPSRPRLTPSGSSTTLPASRPASPTATADDRLNRNAPTPTPV